MSDIPLNEENIPFEEFAPNFSATDIQKIQTYHTTLITFQEDLNTELITILADHKVWGPIIQSLSPEQLLEQNKISQDNQENAIMNGEWIQFIRHNINQGINYADMGVSFKAWYEIISLVRNLIIPRFSTIFENDKEKFNDATLGMNLFLDFTMSVIGEAYIFKKKKIIADKNKIQLKLNKELESFAFIISHDLKTPLRGISNLSTWLVEDYKDVLDKQGLEYVNLIHNRANRLDRLIDGVLQYSRAGKLDAEKQKIDLNELITNTIETYGSNDKIKIKVSEDFPTLEHSPVLYAQLFGNLVNNAIKHNDKEIIEIEINYSKLKKFHKYSVKDNGPGISSAYHDKVFEIFQTLKNKDDDDSTGIGLSIVKKIVDSMDGKLEISNQKQGGCNFSFYIPINS